MTTTDCPSTVALPVPRARALTSLSAVLLSRFDLSLASTWILTGPSSVVVAVSAAARTGATSSSFSNWRAVGDQQNLVYASASVDATPGSAVVLSGRVLDIHGNDRPVDERVDFFFTCTRWTGEPSVCEPEKSGGLRWCALDALPEPVVPHERWVLDALRAGAVPPITTFGFADPSR